MLPPTLHVPQGTLVSFITICDDISQVMILSLYYLISGIPAEQELTWSTQLTTCHGFHGSRRLSRDSAVSQDEWDHEGLSRHLSVPFVRFVNAAAGRSVCRLNADQVARGVTKRAVAHTPWLGRRLLEHLGA